MKTNQLLFFLPFLFLSFLVNGQSPPASTFGGFHSTKPYFEKDEISPEQRQEIYNTIKANVSMLAQKGITSQNQSVKGPGNTVKFGWPVQKAAGFTDPGYYTIVNFVDVNPASGVKDYNCGTRTYDGHMGTDISPVPFWWKKMDENSVEIVAAADGIIVAKAVNIDDKNCANCPNGAPNSCFHWNAVYLQHSDGTLTMYGHMKKNSPTSKVIGDAVVKGEFLGLVGSSGNSSGPHLHFEVWEDTTFTKMLNPWAGPCNPDQNASMWDVQQSYYKPEIIKLMTGTALIETKQCYGTGPEKTFETNEFNYGQNVFITSFIRDHRGTGENYFIKLTGPANNIIYNYQLAANNYAGYYTWLWFYYSWGKSVFSVPGTYKFSLTYMGEVQETLIKINYPAPLNLLSFSAKAADEKAILNWQTTDESNTSHFEIERGTDADNFYVIGKVMTTGNDRGGKNNYSLNDLEPAQGINFYRLKMVDKDGQFTYSNIEKVNIAKINTVRVFPNPATNIVTLQGVSKYSRVRISSLQGSELLSKNFEGDELKLNISHLPAGVYLLQLGKDAFDYNIKLIKK
jgi:murein DD-endopeptidase MepM/ murein hydrolase activator NlpD